MNTAIFKFLCSGSSQRRIAANLGLNRKTVALRVLRFGEYARGKLEEYRISREVCRDVCFDEMESFEHTKCKPLTLPIAVENKTRVILALDVGSIAAKGHLAKMSVKKYGRRKCERRSLLKNLMQDLQQCCNVQTTFRTDQSKHYPLPLKDSFPSAKHIATKGDRGCVVGQGELKATGFDPIFSLNHTYASIRCNLKRLSRRTWCTTKDPENLKHMLFMNAWFHNTKVLGKKRVLLQ